MATRQKDTDRIELTTADFYPTVDDNGAITSKSTKENAFALDESALSKNPALVIIYGSNMGHIFELEPGEHLLGRDEDCAIMLSEQEVSRRHCKISVTSAGVEVNDLDSTNGTYVNDERFQEKTIHNGDRLRIGGTMLKYLSQKNVEKTYHDEIVNRTNVDSLTEAYNRRYLFSVLHREIGRSARHHRELSVIMLDIDHFKRINDVFGHLVGDSVLRAIVANIRDHIRREDVLTRYGGEEFMVVLPEITYDNAFLCAEKLRVLIRDTEFQLQATRIPITISLGVASCQDTDDAASLIEAADKALYEAKRGGRDRVCGRDAAE